VTGDPVSFAARFWLAFAILFRVLFDGHFAREARALASGQAPALPEPPAAPTPPPTARTASDAALRGDGAIALLSVFQREGRLVDFIQQDIAAFPDAEIGAAARVVHDGCRKALGAHLDVARVRTEPEGSRVTVATGFDAAEIKLTGDVRGAAPYQGTLRHSGWRVTGVRLPERVAGHDDQVIFPAEVEL
jgi:hypothetical protein